MNDQHYHFTLSLSVSPSHLSDTGTQNLQLCLCHVYIINVGTLCPKYNKAQFPRLTKSCWGADEIEEGVCGGRGGGQGGAEGALKKI